ncbi:hypothetical protein V2J09_003841 [Rumex salicifolius]
MDSWDSSSSLKMDDEFEKLVLRMNPPRVTVDNKSSKTATLIKVDSANKRGSLLEVVQVLTDLNLIIKRAYISSDGEWFMDVFHVTDQHGNKLKQSEGVVAERIQTSLGPRARSFRSQRKSVGDQPAMESTSIELCGTDRPGLLSEIFALLHANNCNVVGAEVWTHNSRMASVLYVTDELTGDPIDDKHRMEKIEKLLLSVLMKDRDRSTARTDRYVDLIHKERRLHQMMNAELGGVSGSGSIRQRKTLVTVEGCEERGYTVVNLRCMDRPKLLFDAVCTLTDMGYVVYHATVTAEGHEACQEYYIRHKDGYPRREEEMQRLVDCLEAAIKRRNSEGIRLELCCEDRVGLLRDVTQIFREHGLSVTRAEVSTRGSQAVNTFYVVDSSGNPVKSEIVESTRKAIGLTFLSIKEDEYYKTPPQETGGRFSFGNLFKSQSERFLFNLGLIKS